MNQENIKGFYKLLRHEKQTELRAINPKTKQVKSFHFFGEEELLKLCRELNGKYNLYLGVNERREGGTEAKDVIKVKTIPIDIDCVKKPATDNDIMEAMAVATNMIKNAEKRGYCRPSIAFSGNGYQIFFSIPEIIITEENREKVENHIQEFQNILIKKYSNDKVKLDQVGDLPRIMRIAGTYNLKSQTTGNLIELNIKEDKKLREDLLGLKISKQAIIGNLSPELKEKIEQNSEVQKLFNADPKATKKFQSRSEAELSLVCRLVGLGLNKEQIFRTMTSCKLGKWQESNIKYREVTYRKAIELISKETLAKCDNPTLQDLYTIYKKWLYLEDTKRIDIVLATYLTKFLNGTPIWLIIVGPSGDGKTEQIMALKSCEDIHLEHNMTSRTLVSGNPKVNDLAPELHDKVVIIPDMAQILQLPPQEKGELWGQLRDLYDGFAGKSSGLGKRAKYDNLRVTILACSTPKIDGQILVHQDLGTRELIYRTEDTENKVSLMEYAMKNERKEKEMKAEMRKITKNFLKGKKVVYKEINEEENKKLMNIALFITKIRASAEIDSYTNEIRNIVYPEQPTRIVKQLKRVYMALLSLEAKYPKNRAFSILWHLAESCAFPIRINIYKFFIRNFFNEGENTKWYTTSSIANNLMIGKKTAQRELNVLWNMGILLKDEREEGNRYHLTDYWKINEENHFIKDYIELLRVHRGSYIN